MRCFHLLIAKILFRKRVLVTIHSIWGKTPVKIHLIRLALKLADRVIAVNSDILEKLGLINSVIQPAFIPPELDTEPELPAQISRWLENQRGQSRKIIAANAFRIELYEGQDLYGIDISLEMMRQLVHDQGQQISLIFIISSVDRAGRKLDEYLQLIKEWELEDHILLACISLSFVKLINHADIVLRPTCTDGDALTIREALYFNKPVVASDMVTRPEGTVLFRNRDAKNLSEKVSHVLMDNEIPAAIIRERDYYRDLYRTIYTQL